MTIVSAKPYVEQISYIVLDHINKNPNHFSAEEIDANINALTAYTDSWNGDENAEVVINLIDRALVELYFAQNYVNADIRGRDYYDSMIRAKRIFQTIKSLP